MGHPASTRCRLSTRGGSNGNQRLWRGLAGGDEIADSENMYSIYIIKSLNKEWYYVGHTQNKNTRLKYHNGGRVKSTKFYAPFALVYSEEFKTKSEAFKREQQIKRYRHGEAFNKLIGV